MVWAWAASRVTKIKVDARKKMAISCGKNIKKKAFFAVVFTVIL
jgi:hypothetical protein